MKYFLFSNRTFMPASNVYECVRHLAPVRYLWLRGAISGFCEFIRCRGQLLQFSSAHRPIRIEQNRQSHGNIAVQTDNGLYVKHAACRLF